MTSAADNANKMAHREQHNTFYFVVGERREVMRFVRTKKLAPSEYTHVTDPNKVRGFRIYSKPIQLIWVGDPCDHRQYRIYKEAKLYLGV